MAFKSTGTIVTPEFRLDFPSVFEPKKKNKPEDADVYSITMIFEPKEDFTDLKRIVQEAIELAWGNNPPSYVKKPLRKGVQKSEKHPNGYDLSKYPQYEGKIITTASSYITPPGVVDASVNDILDKKAIYSGCYCKAEINAYGYDNKGGEGITFGLSNLQKLRDGQVLSGLRSNPKDVFEKFTPPEGENDDLLEDLDDDIAF